MSRPHIPLEKMPGPTHRATSIWPALIFFGLAAAIAVWWWC